MTRKITPEYKAKEASRVQRTRLNALSMLSNHMSMSNVPCCNCCGETGTDFLDIDHIQGKKVMDNIPELTNLGYSSTFTLPKLIKWLKSNEYLKDLDTDYFQVLCKNCNGAKAMPKNKNICPHKHKEDHAVDSIYIERRSWIKGNGYYKNGYPRGDVKHSSNLPIPTNAVELQNKPIHSWKSYTGAIKIQNSSIGVDLSVGDII